MSISIVLPVFNEEAHLKKSNQNIIKAIKKSKIINYEIIFINDCSTDGSNKILKELKKNNKKIRVYNNFTNIGQGLSIQRGYKVAKKNYVCWIPSDNNLKYQEIVKFLKDYKSYDFFLTYHLIERPLIRSFVSKCYTILVNIIFFKNLKYYNCLHLIKKNLIGKIKIKSKSSFWGAETTLNLIKLSDKYKVKKLNLMERKSGKSKIFNFEQFFLTSIDLIYYRLNLL